MPHTPSLSIDSIGIFHPLARFADKIPDGCRVIKPHEALGAHSQIQVHRPSVSNDEANGIWFDALLKIF